MVTSILVLVARVVSLLACLPIMHCMLITYMYIKYVLTEIPILINTYMYRMAQQVIDLCTAGSIGTLN